MTAPLFGGERLKAFWTRQFARRIFKEALRCPEKMQKGEMPIQNVLNR